MTYRALSYKSHKSYGSYRFATLHVCPFHCSQIQLHVRLLAPSSWILAPSSLGLRAPANCHNSGR